MKAAGMFAQPPSLFGVMVCATCGAPAVVLKGACVFCRTPVDESNAPAELLDYLAAHLPAAKRKRDGLVRKRGVREFEVMVEGKRFQARVVRGRLRLEPDMPPARWLDTLLEALSDAAARDADVRSAFTRSGWALR
jgi:hypothetical protein